VWSIEITDEFEAWFNTLDEGDQDAVRASILLLDRAIAFECSALVRVARSVLIV
jgi:hypothetical protein